MSSRFAPRLAGALAIAVLGGLAVFLVAGVDGAAVALVAGIAAALAALGIRESVAVPAPTAPADTVETARGMLDAIAEPVLLVRAGVITFANAAAQRLLGRHIAGEDVRTAIRHPAATERLVAPIGDERPIELVGLGRADQRWEMRTGDTADGARIVHLVDQTAPYAAEKMRVDFVANASHELRTPLASILGYAETLADEAGEDAALRARFLGTVASEARRMQRLVEDLISLSRIEAEKYRLPSERIDLAELAEAVYGELCASGDDRADDVVLAIEPDVAIVAGDRAQLSQLLHNLIGNAMKYGRAGTPVLVTLKNEGERLRLAVADRGEGIPPEHLPRLTERFYRVDNGRSRSLGGTGLGLAIAKHVVERHRGRLDIASRMGVGTTVSVTLPTAGPAVTKG